MVVGGGGRVVEGQNEVYPNFELSGVPRTCFGGYHNGEWTFVGKTADGRPYYSRWDAGVNAWVYIYYDKDCDGNAGGVGRPAWIIDDGAPPSTTAKQDLDGDGDCIFTGYTVQSTTSTTPPSGAWNVYCNDAFTSIALILTPPCPTTPDYTYVWGKWSPQQTDGTSCGELDQREAEGGCTGGLGCCINYKENQEEVRPQAPCPTEEGDYAHLTVSGMPTPCFDGYLNGVWQYVGQTADTRPYYKWWFSSTGEWRYMFYDKECGTFAEGGSANRGWFVYGTPPSLTATQGLGSNDNAGACLRKVRCSVLDKLPFLSSGSTSYWLQASIRV
jgi:hypothetical protein